MKAREVEPLISIVVPVYGTEKYVDRCINSLINQTYKNVQIIIVNDGSPGNISEIMKKYLTFPQIEFIDNLENNGLLRARVIGAKKAKGEYIAFVDSDDYVTKDYYRLLVNNCKASDADITIGNTVWEKNGERFIYNYHQSCFNFDSLVGNEIKERYFGQENQCYSWHTIWNKIYKKELWDICAAEFESVEEHIIMTEDIYFSSILFFNAKKISYSNGDAYFYCTNENASTNSEGITIQKYKKNMHDIALVFDRVDSYLEKNNASTFIKNKFKKGREHYGRMWMGLASTSFVNEDRKESIGIIADFCENLGTQRTEHDYYFESVQTPWNGAIEFIKNKIYESDKKYISFDIFDTLIMRPFYNPTDIHFLLNSYFSNYVDNAISFNLIRKEGEEFARNYYGNKFGYEDITLEEIYSFIGNEYRINSNVCKKMMQKEQELEIQFSTVRRTGRELLEYAISIGKKPILISDMYLNRNTIEKILEKNGIFGYEKIFISCEERKLKYNGGLFIKALQDLEIDSNDIIHLGDTWKSDIEGSSLVKIENIFFPKAIEVFENKIHGNETNRCGNIVDVFIGGNIKLSKLKDNLGYRSMLAIIANRYFDNPYRTFSKESDLNIDPYFIGYYPLGMHILGVVKWLHSICTEKGYSYLFFLARDGYLPYRAYLEYSKYCEEKIDFDYIQASRKAVLPIMLKNSINFYQMPVEYLAHTPNTLLEVLKFATNVKTYSDVPFSSKENYHAFIKEFLDKMYDEKKHEKAIDLVREYYSVIPDNSVTFDMGYSGRIQGSICEASGKNVDAAFIHEDYNSSIEFKKKYNFRISSFYNYKPEISGLIREHIFSDFKGSCVGFKRQNNKVIPILEDNLKTYPDQFVVETMQRGALDFVKDFLNIFKDYLPTFDYSYEEVSLPFEALLRYPNEKDMSIFSASYFEDLVYGAQKEINIRNFIFEQLLNVCSVLVNNIAEKSITEDEERILNLIHRSSQLKRGLVWAILDSSLLKEKIRINYRRLRKNKGE